EVDERGLVVAVELEHVGKRGDGPIDETAAPVVETQTEQDVGVLDAIQAGPLQQGLVFLNCAADLTFLAVEVAENEPQLEGAGIDGRCLLELVNRQVYLAGDEIVQTEDEVRRLANPAAIDPVPLDELVALPRLAGRQAGQQCDENRDEGPIRLHDTQPESARTSASQRPRLLSNSST